MREHHDDQRRQTFDDPDEQPGRGPMPKGVVRGVLAILFVIVLVLAVTSLTGSRSGATPAPEAPGAPTSEAGGDDPQPPGDDPQVAVVVDSSAAMGEPGEVADQSESAEEPGSSDAADPEEAARGEGVSEALTGFAEAVPADLPVGLFAYGSEVDVPEGFGADEEDDSSEDSGGFFDFLRGDDSDEESEEDEDAAAIDAACTDFRTVQPVGDFDAAGFTEGVDSLEPTGLAGLAAALRSASGEFSGPGPHSIVLVTSGVNDCAPPPCEAAAELAEQADVEVHIAGYRVADADSEQLDCTARVTGGTYRQADDADALEASLVRLADRVADGGAPNDRELSLAGEVDSAPFLGEGLYRSTVTAWAAADTPPRRHHAAIAVPDEHNVHISVTPYPLATRDLPDEDNGDGENGPPSGEVTLTAENSDAECSLPLVPEASSTIGGGEIPDAATIVLRQPDDGTCDPEGWSIRVQPSIEAPSESDPVDFPVDISVQAEPRLPLNVVDTMTPGQEGEGRPSTVEITDPTAVVPGETYNEATPIEPDSYSGAITPGAVQYFRVPVEWGEQVSATLRAGPSVREVAESVTIGVVNPMRVPLDSAPANFYLDERERTIGTDREVLYRNRQMIRPGPDHAMAGEHYVVVAADPLSGDRSSNDIEQEYEFAVDVSGEGDEGPEWRPKNEPGPAPSDTPIEFGDGTTFEGAAEPPSEVATEEEGSSSQLWGALFALVLLAGVAGFVFVRSRKDAGTGTG